MVGSHLNSRGYVPEDPYPGRKLPFTVDMVEHAIIFHRARDTVGDRLVALAFRCGFCHLLRALEYLNPSGSKLSRHCILAKHMVFQYRTEAVDAWRGSLSTLDSV